MSLALNKRLRFKHACIVRACSNCAPSDPHPYSAPQHFLNFEGFSKKHQQSMEVTGPLNGLRHKSRKSLQLDARMVHVQLEVQKKHIFSFPVFCTKLGDVDMMQSGNFLMTRISSPGRSSAGVCASNLSPERLCQKCTSQGLIPGALQNSPNASQRI